MVQAAQVSKELPRGTGSATADRYVIEESGSARYGYERGYARIGPHLETHMDNLLVDPLFIQNSVEYVVNLCGGSTRVRLARSVVGVTSRALAVPLPDVYSPTPSQSDD